MNVIGNGRVGSYIASLTAAKVYSRNDPLVGFNEGPIVIATRNDDLAAIIPNIPKERMVDLVFIQNGMYLTKLESLGVTNPTLILIYFAIQSKGDKPVDGGGTLITGKHSSFFVNLFTADGIEIKEVEKPIFYRAMFEKLLWNCVFGLLCRIHNSDVGTLVLESRDEIYRLTDDLIRVIEDTQGVSLDSGVVDRLCEYSLTIAAYQGDVKEFKWRNGWFLEQKRTPLHLDFLDKANLGFSY